LGLMGAVSVLPVDPGIVAADIIAGKFASRLPFLWRLTSNPCPRSVSPANFPAIMSAATIPGSTGRTTPPHQPQSASLICQHALQACSRPISTSSHRLLRRPRQRQQYARQRRCGDFHGRHLVEKTTSTPITNGQDAQQFAPWSFTTRTAHETNNYNRIPTMFCRCRRPPRRHGEAAVTPCQFPAGRLKIFMEPITPVFRLPIVKAVTGAFRHRRPRPSSPLSARAKTATTAPTKLTYAPINPQPPSATATDSCPPISTLTAEPQAISRFSPGAL